MKGTQPGEDPISVFNIGSIDPERVGESQGTGKPLPRVGPGCGSDAPERGDGPRRRGVELTGKEEK